MAFTNMICRLNKKCLKPCLIIMKIAQNYGNVKNSKFDTFMSKYHYCTSLQDCLLRSGRYIFSIKALKVTALDV